MGKGEVMKRKLEKYMVSKRKKEVKKKRYCFPRLISWVKVRWGENSGALILESSTTVVTLLHGPTPS